MKEIDLRSLPSLSLPYADLRIAKDSNGNLKVFDILRKKFVALTPEEFVRQNFIHWLVGTKNYPQSLIANEVEIKLNDTKKRSDTVVYDRQCRPVMIIEYKAPDIEITQDTFDQIVRYNMELQARYLVVSNGRNHYCCVVEAKAGTYNFVKVIPEYNDMVGMPGVN